MWNWVWSWEQRPFFEQKGPFPIQQKTFLFFTKKKSVNRDHCVSFLGLNILHVEKIALLDNSLWIILGNLRFEFKYEIKDKNDF